MSDILRRRTWFARYLYVAHEATPFSLGSRSNPSIHRLPPRGSFDLRVLVYSHGTSQLTQTCGRRTRGCTRHNLKGVGATLADLTHPSPGEAPLVFSKTGPPVERRPFCEVKRDLFCESPPPGAHFSTLDGASGQVTDFSSFGWCPSRHVPTLAGLSQSRSLTLAASSPGRGVVVFLVSRYYLPVYCPGK